MIVYKPVENSADIQLVSDLAYQLFPKDYGDYVRAEHIRYFLDEFQTPEVIQEQINGNYTYFLFYEKEELLGYMGICVEENMLELSKIYLLFDKRGRGIGNRVMKWLENYAKENGCNTVELDVLVENKRALGFYKALGFEIKDKFDRHFKTGYSETNYRMIKELQ